MKNWVSGNIEKLWDIENNITPKVLLGPQWPLNECLTLFIEWSDLTEKFNNNRNKTACGLHGTLGYLIRLG